MKLKSINPHWGRQWHRFSYEMLLKPQSHISDLDKTNTYFVNLPVVSKLRCIYDGVDFYSAPVTFFEHIMDRYQVHNTNNIYTLDFRKCSRQKIEIITHLAI